MFFCVLRFKVSDFPLSNCLWEKLSALRGLVESCPTSKILSLGTGFKDIKMLSPRYLGRWSNLTWISGWNHQLERYRSLRSICEGFFFYLTVGTIFNLASSCHQKSESQRSAFIHLQDGWFTLLGSLSWAECFCLPSFVNVPNRNWMKSPMTWGIPESLSKEPKFKINSWVRSYYTMIPYS